MKIVAESHSVAVYGKRQIVDRIRDEQRDDLLRVLKWAVSVGAACDDRREPIRGAICVHKHLCAGLAGAVRAPRPQWVFLPAAAGFDLPIHLVGAHLDEASMMRLARRLHECESAVDVGEDELSRCLEGPVDM